MRKACGGHVPKRRKGEGKEGSRYGDKGVGSRADRMPGKGETHSARGQLVRHDVTATRERGANGPDTDGVHRARSEMTQHALCDQLNTGLGT